MAAGDPHTRRILILVFLGFFLLFMITSSGGFESGDAVCRYETAKSFLAGHGGALPPGEPLNGVTQGRDGKTYSTYGPMQALLMVPIIFVADHLPLSDGAKDGLIRLVFNLVAIPLISALALAILQFALMQMSFSPAVATLTVLTIGLATPYWHYSRSAQEENMVALGFSCWLLGMALFISAKRGGLLLAALGACFALATRWASVAPLIPLLAVSTFLLVANFRSIKKGELFIAIVICVGVFAALLGYNAYRFGSPFETGYRIFFNGETMPLFSFSEAPGRILALLFSPYRGLFLYAPVLVLVVAAFFFGRNRRSIIEFSGLAAFLAAFTLNAGYSFWTAGHSWGPRFLVAPLILLAPIFARFFEFQRQSHWWKPLVAISILIQLFSVILPSSTEEIIRERAGVDHLSIRNAWKCNYSPLCLRPPLAARAILNTVLGKPGVVIPQGRKAGEEAIESSDYQTLFWWPFRFSFRFGYFNRYIATLITLLFTCLSCIVLLKLWRTANPPFSQQT